MEPSQTSSVSSEPHSSSTEFSSTEFTPIGRLFLEKQEEKEAEEVRFLTYSLIHFLINTILFIYCVHLYVQIAFLSLTRPNSNGVDTGATLTWRDLSVYVTAPNTRGKRSAHKAPFKRVLNNGKLYNMV